MGQKHSSGYTLDVLFLLDATASMDPYIECAKKRIIEICAILCASGRLRQSKGLRMGLLAYRDYPVEKTGFVVEPHPFTSNVYTMQDYLHKLSTQKNDDPAEAFRTAFDYALTKMKGWRKEAVKVIIVVTDAAPHGIKEDRRKDRHPFAGPEDKLGDPLELATSKADEKYSIVILACEPTLSNQTEHAIAFYRSLADLSLGVFWPVTDHRALSTLILGSLLEKIDLKSLSDKYRDYILERVLTDGAPVATVVDELHERLQNEGLRVMSVKASNPYNASPEMIHNHQTFMSKTSLKDARESLRTSSTPHMNEEARQRIEAKQNELNELNDFQLAEVRLVNHADKTIVMQHFNDKLKPDIEMEIPGGFVRRACFKINVAHNFIFKSGTTTQPLSRTFDRINDEILVHSMFA